MDKVLFTATLDSHILQFHIPYLKMLKEKGYEVHVATNTGADIPYCDVKHVISFERSPLRINNLKAIKQLKKIIDKENFRVIHCNTPMGGVVTRLAARKARKNQTKVIYTAHGFHFYKDAPLLNWLVYYPIEKWLSKYTDSIITINEEDYNLAKNKFKTKEVNLVHGVGVDETKFSFEMTDDEKKELKNSLELQEDDYILIQVAELNKNKNQLFSIKVMRELVKENKKIHLLLVGDGDFRQYYERIIEEYNLKSNIHMLGYRKDVAKLLKISNVLLSLSYREGLPVNVIEGMICKKSIIATDCRGNRDLIDECIEIDNISELKARIKDNYNIKQKEYDFSKYLNIEILTKMDEIYSRLLKKNVIMLRSTEIINDSRIQKEAKAILSNGNNVRILGWDRKNLFKKNEDIEGLNIEFFKLKSTYGNGIKNILKIACFQLFLFSKLIKHRRSCDVIFSCDLDTGIVARVSAKILNKKMIYDIYDYYVDCHNLPKTIKKFAEKQEIKNINYANATIICTEERKEQIKKSNPKELIVVHNSPEIPKNICDLPSIIKSKTNKTKIVYVGILQDDRLLHEIGEIIKDNQQYELHIGGFGRYEDYFRKLAAEYENVFFYGMLEYDKVLRLESECDVLFATYNPEIANHKYSAPNKLYEAMALGKPIIVCKNTGVDNIVNKYDLGVTIDYNNVEFIKCLDQLQNKNYKKSVELYNSTYSWDKMKDKILKIL